MRVSDPGKKKITFYTHTVAFSLLELKLNAGNLDNALLIFK